MNKILLMLSRLLLPLLLVGALAIFLLSNSYSYSDADLGWHIRVGQDIISEQHAPSINHYNYPLEDQTWVDHEWLLNLGIASAFRVGGFTLLHLLFVAIVLIIALLNWQRVKLVVGDSLGTRIVGLTLIVLGVWASSPHFGIRVQEFGLLLITILLYIFQLYPQKLRLLWLLPPLFCLWANIHGSFLLGLALLLTFTIYIFLQILLKKFRFLKPFLQVEYSLSDKLYILIASILSISATFINPYGFGLYSFLGGYANTFYMSYIQEWLGQDSLPLHYGQLSYLGLAVTMTIVYFRKNWKKGAIGLWEVGISLLFFILAFKSRRHFPIFFVASLPLLTTAVLGIFSDIEIQFGKIIRKWIYFSTVILLSLYIIFTAIKQPWNHDGIEDFCAQTYPCGAVDYLRSRPELKKKTLFSEYNWGGYLLYSYPERKIFIDGRMPQANYKEHSLIQEYLLLRRLEGDFDALTDEYDIDLMMIYSQNRYPKISRWEKILFWIQDDKIMIEDKLRTKLEESGDWRRVYSDMVANVYERIEP